jgi:hypothetical protein
MNDVLRQKLAELVVRFGPRLGEDAKRCEALLRDMCGDVHKREICVLISAVREQVPSELVSSSNSLPKQILLGRLSKRMHDNLGIAEELSLWGVESWAMALGFIQADEITSLFRCPGCGATDKLRRCLVGTKATCRECQTKVLVSTDSTTFSVIDDGRHASHDPAIANLGATPCPDQDIPGNRPVSIMGQTIDLTYLSNRDPKNLKGTVTQVQEIDAIPRRANEEVETATGKFVVVFMDPENRGLRSEKVYEGHLKLRDQKGRFFDLAGHNVVQNAARQYFQRWSTFDSIQPGMTKPMVFVFDVARDAAGYCLEDTGIV